MQIAEKNKIEIIKLAQNETLSVFFFSSSFVKSVCTIYLEKPPSVKISQKVITIVTVVVIPKISGAKILDKIAVVIGVINFPIISPKVVHFKDFLAFV